MVVPQNGRRAGAACRREGGRKRNKRDNSVFRSSASLFSTPFKYPEKTGVTGGYPEHSYKSRNSHPPRRPHHKPASPSVGSQRRQLLPGHEHTIVTYPPRWNRMGHVLWKEAWADSQVAPISVSFRLCTCHCPVT